MEPLEVCQVIENIFVLALAYFEPQRLGTATPSSNGAAQPAAAAANQTDYSAEWAEYYRRLGKTEEAEAIEKQISASKVIRLLFIS